MKRVIVCLLMLLQLVEVNAGISFGSRDSAIEANGGSFTFSGNATLANGTLRDMGTGSIGNATTKTLTCTNMTIEKKDGATIKTMRVDGGLDTDASTVSLGNNKVLSVNGGQVAETVTVAGAISTPSIISGNGSFASAINVDDNAGLLLRWQGDFDADIDMNSGGTNTSKVTFDEDFSFAPGKTFTTNGSAAALNVVNFNGHTATFNGATIGQAQTWDTAKINLEGDLTLNAAITLGTAAAVINGGGYTIGGTSGFAGSQNATLSNATLSTYDVSTLGGSGAWTLNNVDLKTSGGAVIRVNSGSVTGGAANIFGAATTWTPTNIELLSNITPAGTWTLGGNSIIVGNGAVIDFSSAGISHSTNTLTLSDVHLTNYSSNLLVGSGARYLKNVTFDSGSTGECLRVVNGSLTGATSGVLSGSLTWGNGSTVELLKTVSTSGTWTLGSNFILSGNKSLLTGGIVLDNSGNAAYLNDFSLVSTSSTLTGAGTWFLKDMRFLFNNDVNRLLISGSITSDTVDLDGGVTTFGAVTKIALESDFTVSSAAIWQLGSDNAIRGGGSVLSLADLTLTPSAALKLENIALTGVIAASIDNTAGVALQMDDVRWYDSAGAGAALIKASPLNAGAKYASVTLDSSGTDGLLFNDAVTFDNGVHMQLLANTTLGTSASWTLSDESLLEGAGHMLTFGSTGKITLSDNLYLSNVTLGDMVAANIDNSGAKDLYLSNVVWIDGGGAGSIRVNATSESATVAAAQVSLATSATAAGLFASAVTWDNGANIELLKNIQFSGAGSKWTFSDSTVINGNGNVIDLNSLAGALTIADGKTLTISNAVIKGWGSTGTIASGGTSTLNFSNVTIITNGSVTTSGLNINVNGPLSIVTGSNSFNASAGTNVINGLTVWYDTLGTTDISNVNFGSFSGGGRVAASGSGGGGSGSSASFSSSSTYAAGTLFLSYDINTGGGALEATGTQITLDNSSAFTLRGDGHTWFMPVAVPLDATATKLITVGDNAGNLVTVKDLTIERWSAAHIDDTNGDIRYGDGSVIRLGSNEALNTAIVTAAAANTDVVIDLNGYEMDFSDASAAVTLSDASGATLTFKNGRITKLSGTKIAAGGANPTLIFQDVDLTLADDASFSACSITFKGDCSLSGDADKTLSMYHTPITIDASATLHVEKGMTLKLCGNGLDTDASIAFSSANSTLDLQGATFDVSTLVAEPTFQTGTIRIDDIVTLVGAMTLGHATNDLDIDLMPGASIVVTSGTVTYANAS